MEDLTEDQFDTLFSSETTLRDSMTGFLLLAQQARRIAAPGKYARPKTLFQLTRTLGERYMAAGTSASNDAVDDFLEALTILSYYETHATSLLVELIRAEVTPEELAGPLVDVYENLSDQLKARYGTDVAIGRIRMAYENVHPYDWMLSNYLHFVANAHHCFVATRIADSPWRAYIPALQAAFDYTLDIIQVCLSFHRVLINSMGYTFRIIPIALAQFSVTRKEKVRGMIKTYIRMLTNHSLCDDDAIQTTQAKQTAAFMWIFDDFETGLVFQIICDTVLELSRAIRNITSVATPEDTDMTDFLVIWIWNIPDENIRLEMLQTLFIFVGRNYERAPLTKCRRLDVVRLLTMYLERSPPISEELRAQARRWLASPVTAVAQGT